MPSSGGDAEMSTGQPREDAKIAFDKERRRRALARLGSRMRFEADDVSHMLPFEEVVAALGATSRHAAGEKVIPLDAIVGTVDRRSGEFDRSFRPSPNTRGRWERIAEARKRGEAMPPIDVFQIGDLYFVQDGHHRVSVARAMGDKDINANVIQVRDRRGAQAVPRIVGRHARGDRRGDALPLLRRGFDGYRRRTRSGWRAGHLSGQGRTAD